MIDHRTTDFLDATFGLATGEHRLYRKLNDYASPTHKHSNHPHRWSRASHRGSENRSPICRLTRKRLRKLRQHITNHRCIPSGPDQLTMVLYVETSQSPYGLLLLVIFPLFSTVFTLFLYIILSSLLSTCSLVQWFYILLDESIFFNSLWCISLISELPGEKLENF